MNKDELLARWRAEERIACIKGWDFSHIADRHTSDELPWNYRQKILNHLRPSWKLLDIDTGGGEFLLSLRHPHENTAASEDFPPNVALCRQVLLPLGIDFRAGSAEETLPFEDNSFDLIINRHGSFCAADIHRLLKPGGLFITQQVGAENDAELIELLCGHREPAFPGAYLSTAAEQFRAAGFRIQEEAECFRPIRFFDIGALVWFARVLPWEFPDFSVDTCADNLFRAQRILEETGAVKGRMHRFLLVAEKPYR